MRISGMLIALETIACAAAPAASADDCTRPKDQAAQIACLQREVEGLRREVDELRSLRSLSEAEERSATDWVIEERIRQALADLEHRLEEKFRPRVHLLD